MENSIKTLTYAGLGLASEANENINERFDELVEAGKEKDASGKNVIGDFFKTVESSKADFETQIEKMKTKAKDTFPFVKEMTAESDAEIPTKQDSVEEAVEI